MIKSYFSYCSKFNDPVREDYIYLFCNMDSLSSISSRGVKRHYKKDSRFVGDLYTLTYDDHESLDTVELINVFDEEVGT